MNLAFSLPTFFSNTTETSTPKLDWIKLVDYGEHPHRLGMQVITEESAREMVKNFHSLWGKFTRKFRGVPIYIGHPDDPHFQGKPGHSDTRAYAWVKDIAARHDGIWILPKWSEAGRDLLKNAYFKFLSPRWEMTPLGAQRFAPRALVSIGLTNNPNIPVEAIANQIDIQDEALSNDDSRESVIETQSAVSQETFLSKETPKSAPSSGDSQNNELEKITAETSRSSAELLLQQLAELLQITNTKEGILSRIQQLLANSKITFPNTHSNTNPFSKSQVSNLFIRQNGPAGRQKKSQRVLALVNERMKTHAEDYELAWKNVKAEHTELFQ